LFCLPFKWNLLLTNRASRCLSFPAAGVFAVRQRHFSSATQETWGYPAARNEGPREKQAKGNKLHFGGFSITTWQ